MSGSPKNWVVMQGSILDARFMETLPKSDLVYSWGVLNHTGSMWEAIKNGASCMHDQSIFYIALYSKDVYVSPPYQYWLDIKRRYNLATPLKKRWMEWQYAWRDCIRSQLARGKNPISFMKAYKQSRGMSYWHDVKDWLGGYPMEFAGNKETEIFGRNKLELELIHIKAGEGNTEFLFKELGEKTYWDEVSKAVKCTPIIGEFNHVVGFCWKVELPEGMIGSPDKFMLYENDSPVG